MPIVDPSRLPVLIAAAATLALAIALASIDMEKRVNRAFAVFLALRATALGLQQFNLGARGNLAIITFTPYLLLALIPTALYFASLYPRRRGPLAGRYGGYITLGIIAALDFAYFLRHDLYYTVTTSPAASPALQAGTGVAYTSFGPLVVFGSGAFVVLAALALLFVKDYVRTGPGRQRTSYFLVASGFLVNALFDGVGRTVNAYRMWSYGWDYPWADWGWAVAGLPTLSLIPAILALALIARHRFKEKGEENRREKSLYLLSACAILTGLLPLLLPSSSTLMSYPAMLILLGLWRLTLPIFVSYALLRYALFDIDLKVRAAVGWSVITAIFGGTYFLFSELTSNVIQEKAGNMGGLVAAALLALAVKPITVVGRKAAGFIIPNVPSATTSKDQGALDIYRQQFLMLQEDGQLSKKERLCLENLRQRLGLEPGKIRALEQSIRPAGFAALAAA